MQVRVVVLVIRPYGVGTARPTTSLASQVVQVGVSASSGKSDRRECVTCLFLGALFGPGQYASIQCTSWLAAAIRQDARTAPVRRWRAPCHTFDRAVVVQRTVGHGTARECELPARCCRDSCTHRLQFDNVTQAFRPRRDRSPRRRPRSRSRRRCVAQGPMRVCRGMLAHLTRNLDTH